MECEKSHIATWCPLCSIFISLFLLHLGPIPVLFSSIDRMNAIMVELLLLFRVNQNEQQILLVICGGGWILWSISYFRKYLFVFKGGGGGWFGGLCRRVNHFACLWLPRRDREWRRRSGDNLCPKMIRSLLHAMSYSGTRYPLY